MSRRPLLTAAALVLAALAGGGRAAEDRVEARTSTPSRPSALAIALDEIVARTPLHAARTGILVTSLDTGAVLYARNPDALLNPASNVKLFTSAAVLARLGPEYRFRTELSTDVAPSGGSVGALYVRGRGDPTFVTERMWLLAAEIAHHGVKVVRGDLVVDDTFFDEAREGPGYDQERGDRSYLAPVGALSLNFNSVAIHVVPGLRVGERARVEVEPPSDYLEVESRLTTVKASGRRRVQPSSMRLGNGRWRVAVEGRIPLGSQETVLYRRVGDPPIYFGATLKRLLDLRGVRVTGAVRRGAVPVGARPLLQVESVELGEIVRMLDKSSNNFMAEQLLKTLGAERKGTPGTWPKGVEAVEDFLAEVGIPRGGYVLKNGSGLNDTNRFTPRQTVTLLRAMWSRFSLLPDFLAALPAAGKDGTTRYRMGAAEGRVRAKTGTLETAVCLSGYAETAGYERLAFSVLVNDFAGRAHPVVRAVDAIGNALAAAGGAPAALGAAVASAAPPGLGAGKEAEADLAAHLASYVQLGRAAERGNVPFLRSSLATESDPVLRLAAAEALYRSDPDSDAARRLLLDAVAADGASFPRLRALLAKVPSAPLPLLPSVADLASEGGVDALARLIDLSPLAAADPALRDALSDLWNDVARQAPDETVRALRIAPAVASEAAVAALAQGLARDRQGEHPFLPAVHRASSDPDGEVAAYAQGLEARLVAARSAREAGGPPTVGPAPR